MSPPLASQLPAISGKGHSASYILHLPDETLLAILESVRGPVEEAVSSLKAMAGSPSPDIASIRNVRLVCRRFSHLGAHFLTGVVHVRLESASLKHLEAVANHPIFQTQVKVVKVLCAFYNAAIAESAGLFADVLFRLADHLHSEANSELWAVKHLMQSYPSTWPVLVAMGEFEALRAICWWGLPDIEREHEWPAPFLTQRRKYENWLAMSEPDRDPSVADLRARILRGHAEYQQRFREQEAGLSDGSLMRSLASTLAKMPNATTLVIHDYDKPRGSGFYVPPDPWKVTPEQPFKLDRLLPRDGAFGDQSVHPALASTYSEYYEHDVSMRAPDGFIMSMLGAMGEAGVRLDSLRIRLRCPSVRLMAAPEVDCQPGVALAVSKLKTLELSLREDAYAVREHRDDRQLFRDWDGMYATAVDSVLSQAPRLERLALHIGSQERCRVRTFQYSPTCSASPERYASKSLQHVRLTGQCLTLANLQDFLEVLDSSVHGQSSFEMHHVFFFAHKFADVLDMLRDARVRRGSDFAVEITHPKNADCYDEQGYGCNRLDDIFGNDSCFEDKLADRFLRALSDVNPMREYDWSDRNKPGL